MATTTPNFGWSVPTSTDLVKDGATAIETLGDSIDASLLDLKGGTSGQVLAKNSNTDMDFVWVTTDDTNAIQNEIVDAKGDLIAATAADTPARLAVGTNGQVLTADSTAATGLAWTTVSSTPSFIGVRLNKSGTQSFANATDTAVTWDVEQFDTDDFHSTSTNTSRITIPTGKGGKYLFNARMLWATQAGGSRELKFFKNGSEIFWMPMALAPTQTGAAYTTFLEVAAADYLEVYAWQNSGYSVKNIAGLSSEFSAQFLGA